MSFFTHVVYICIECNLNNVYEEVFSSEKLYLEGSNKGLSQDAVLQCAKLSLSSVAIYVAFLKSNGF